MDKYHEQFIPEQVDEQIEQLSHNVTSLPKAQFVRDLGKLYEDTEETPMLERVWERLASHLTEPNNDDVLLPSQQLEVLHNTQNNRQQKGNQRTQQEWSLPRRTITQSRFAQIAAILVTTLLISSMIWMFHLARSSTSSIPMQQASSPGIYVCCTEGELEKIDVHTHQVIWHVHVPIYTATPTTASSGNRIINGSATKQASNRNIILPGAIAIGGDIVYLSINNSIYAYSSKSGILRWYRTFNVTNSTGGKPYISIQDDQLYVFFIFHPGFLALNPTDGTTKATYTFLGNNQTIVGKILYYTLNHDLYAVQLSDKKLLWHYHFNANAMLWGLTVENGILYTQVQMISPYNGLIYTFDARTGNKLWQSSQFLGPMRTIIPTDGMIYVSTVNSGFYALDAHTHVQVWHQSFDAMDTILVDSGILYLNTYNDAPTSILALRVKDGKILWRKNIAGVAIQNVYQGVLYCTSNNTYKRGDVYAFNTRDGSQLWHIPVGSNSLWIVTVA